MLVKRIYIAIIVALVLSTCNIQPKPTNTQPLAAATNASLTSTAQTDPTLAASPSPTLTPTATRTPTFTPSPTASQTSTSTATPQPAPPGGAYVRYFGYNPLDEQYYCGVMTVDGTILDQRFVRPSGGGQHTSPPFYCPEDGWVMGLPMWSPSGERYYFQEYLGEGLYYYYFGQPDSPKITKFMEGHEDFYSKKFAPNLIWLKDDLLYYANYRAVSDQDWVIDDIVLLDGYTLKETKINGPFPTAFRTFSPMLVGSPDGEHLLLQTGSTLEETDFYLIRTANGVKKNITKELRSSLGYEFSSNFPVHWANDSSKFALYSLDGERAIWVIFDQDGTYLTSIDGGETPLAALGKWTPDNRLLIGCNFVSKGNYGEYDLCLFKLSGELEMQFPYQKHWYPLDNSQLSPDGAMLYYLAQIGLSGYPAKMYRLALNTGESELVLDDIYDYSRIFTNEFNEIYKFTGVRWSPDEAWMTLSNSGPFDDSTRLPATTGLLCDPQKQCQNQFGSLVIYGADWWQPPPSWQPGEPLEALSPAEGTVVFEEEFSSLDTSAWTASGALGLTTSEYGAGLKLDGSQESASIRYPVPIPTGNGISIELKFDEAARPFCGLTDGDWNFIGIEQVNKSARSFQSFSIRRAIGDYESQYPEMPAGRWLILFLRIVNQNQLQGQVIDKAYNTVLGGFNVKMEGKWTEHEFNFACEVTDGVLQINKFVELEFPNP